MSFRFLGLAIVVIVFLIGSKIRVSSYGYSWNSSQKQTSPQLRSDFRFTDITAQQGIHFKYEGPKLDPLFEDKERIFFASGSGVSVADVNGDGWMDILLVSAKQGGTNHLYINQKGQGFRESAKEWGIDRFLSHGASVAPIFFDFNNDGKPDLYIARLGCSQLYMNTGNKFIDISQDSGVTDCKNSSGAIPLDFNNDGLLDLYIVRFWNDHNYFKLNTPFVAPENLVNATNGGVNTLYQNLGNGKFQDVTQSAGGGDTHWSWDAAAGDFFNDGSTQLLVANDTGPDQFPAVIHS